MTLTSRTWRTPTSTSRSAAASTEPTTEGADAHIDALAKKYMGVDEYPLRQPGEQRLIIRVEPERVEGLHGG